jgi:protein TonB
VFTAPVESTPVEPIPVDTALAPAEDLSQSTGSPLGAEGGTTDGSEVGKSGGQAGGVPWGVPNGVIDGTGDLPVTNPDRPPRLLQRIQPVYPQDAFVRKIQGVVKLQILIDARGRVARATVIESIPDLDEAARAAVLQWVFAAAVKDGRPVATLAVAPVRFQIY